MEIKWGSCVMCYQESGELLKCPLLSPGLSCPYRCRYIFLTSIEQLEATRCLYIIKVEQFRTSNAYTSFLLIIEQLQDIALFQLNTILGLLKLSTILLLILLPGTNLVIFNLIIISLHRQKRRENKTLMMKNKKAQ